jgi:hypothetical protein
VERADGRGELAEHIDPVAATEWIVIALGTIPTLAPSPAFDIDDAASVGRFFAAQLARGVTRRPPRRNLSARRGRQPTTSTP